MYKRQAIRKVLLIATEGMSRLIDWSDRNTCVLFGDGSGAAVIERGGEEECLLAFVEHAQGNWEAVSYTHLDVYKRQMEPSLLLPMGFGAILVNLPLSGAITQVLSLSLIHILECMCRRITF